VHCCLQQDLTNTAAMQRVRCVRAQANGAQISRPAPPAHLGKAQVVQRLLQAKDASGKTFSQIAAEIGCTNVYAAALFHNQAQLKPGTVDVLKNAVPSLTDDLLDWMQMAPSRRFDPELIQDPTVYRFYEAIMHNGEALKAIINEECGDGIMSAIDVYPSVDVVVGKQGEKRVVVTFNGKYLAYVEGKLEDNVVQVQKKTV